MGLVGSCCCGCTLAQGTVATGIVSVIRAAISLVCGGILIDASPHDLDLDELKKQYPTRSREEIEEAARIAFRAMGWGFIADGVLVLFVSILLFVAVKTKRKGYLLPWIVLQGIAFFLATPTVVYRVVTGGFPLPIAIVALGTVSLMIYLYIVVLSYYKSLAVFAGAHVPMIPSIDPYNQPGYVVNPPGAVAAMPPNGYGPMDIKKEGDPPVYPPSMTMPNTMYPPQYTPTPPQYNPPPPYSQVV